MSTLFLLLINLCISVINVMLIAYLLMGFFGNSSGKAAQFIRRTVETMLTPIRRIFPQSGPIDYSPMILFLILWFLQWMAQRFF